MPEQQGPQLINPAAAIQSVYERYYWMINHGAGVEQLSNLQAELVGYLQTWEYMVRTQGANANSYNLPTMIEMGKRIQGQIETAVQNAGLVEYAQAVNGNLTPEEKKRAEAEIRQRVAAGELSYQDALRQMLDLGFSQEEVQRAAFDVPADAPREDRPPTPDEIAQSILDQIGLPSAGGGDFKPSEPTGPATTPFANDFQNAFGQWQNALAAAGHGGIASGSDSIISRNFQRLQNMYLGELSRRTQLDPTDPNFEDPGVFDFHLVNIGKSTDPQFDQKTDRFQMQRIEPKLTPLAFLQSLDPEDIAASTVPEDRPGRTRAPQGFVGYVRRFNR